MLLYLYHNDHWLVFSANSLYELSIDIAATSMSEKDQVIKEVVELLIKHLVARSEAEQRFNL